ncbi:MAG: hypothetical protein HY751_05030 [Nitrospinae bacterium]|nr:hypothetical protein [Nitrospinota bacterium]
MDKDFGLAIKLLEEKKAQLKDLEERTGRILTLTQEGAPLEDIMGAVDGRDGLILQLTEGDGKLAGILGKPGRKDWLDKKEVAGLKRDIENTLKRIMEMDSSGMKAMEAVAVSIKDDFSAMASGRRTMATYGKTSKPVYAKFIDRKM